MRVLSLTIAAALTVALAGSAPAAKDRKAEAAMLTPIPGAKAQNCVQLSAIRETRVRDDRTIDFYMRGREIYRNTLPYTCPSLGFEEAFSYRTSLSQLCSSDIITVIRRGGSGFAGPSCGLGPFQPVAKAR